MPDLDGAGRPAFGKGVRLRRDPSGAMLLVPEGALMLNESAAAALELVDGTRSIDGIVAELTQRFDVAPGDARADVVELLSRLRERHFVEVT